MTLRALRSAGKVLFRTSFNSSLQDFFSVAYAGIVGLGKKTAEELSQGPSPLPVRLPLAWLSAVCLNLEHLTEGCFVLIAQLLYLVSHTLWKEMAYTPHINRIKKLAFTLTVDYLHVYTFFFLYSFVSSLCYLLNRSFTWLTFVEVENWFEILYSTSRFATRPQQSWQRILMRCRSMEQTGGGQK